MAYTPDPVAVLAARVDDLETRLKKLESAPPAGEPAEDEEAKFLAKWALVPAAEFQAKYRVAVGQPIPIMQVYDETEAIYRARAGYSTYGLPTRGLSRLTTIAWPAIKVIAGATQETAPDLYETGYGLCDPDVAAYGFCIGLFASQVEYQQSLGSAKEPYAYRGIQTSAEGTALSKLLAPNFSGGGPSGG